MAEVTNTLDCAEDPLFIAELILDPCEHEFGNAPCTATGEPCFNTFATCKDRCNFSKDCDGLKVYFSNCEVPARFGIVNYLPWVVESSIQQSNGTALPGEAFSTTAKGSFCVEDLAHNDVGYDPYWPRTGVPIICAEDQPGTLISRFLERWKNLAGRQVNTYLGHCGMESLCEFDKQTWILENPTGPDGSCRYCFRYTDILTVSRDAKIPSASPRGVAVISGDPFPLALPLGINLDGVPTDDEPDANPRSQIGNPLLSQNYASGDPDQDAEIAKIKHICKDGEVLEVQAVINNAVPAGWNLNLVERGVCGSTITTHDAGEAFKIAKTFPAGMHVANVVCDLVESSGVQSLFTLCCDDEPPSKICFESLLEWQCDNPFATLTEDVVICEPTSAKTLINELAESFMALMFIESGRLKMRSLRPQCTTEVVTIEECDTVEGSFGISDDFRPQYTEVLIRHGVRDWSKKVDEENTSINTSARNTAFGQKACEVNGAISGGTLEITSRWFGQRSEFLARTQAQRLLAFYNCPPEIARFSVAPSMARCVNAGDVIVLQQEKVQSATGAPSTARWLVTGDPLPLDAGRCYSISARRLPWDENLRGCFTCEGDCATIIPAQGDVCTGDCLAVF